MVDFFVDNFSSCMIVAVILVAMCPMLESKASIPLALSVALWGEATLSPAAAFFVSMFATLLPAMLVILLARFVKNRTSGFVHDRFLSKFQTKHAAKLAKLNLQSSTFKKCLMLSTFVAIPLPLTGAYTGSIIAGLTKLKLWQCFVSIFVGELISCGVVLLLCLLMANSALYIFLISLGMVVLFVLVNLVMALFGKLRNRKANKEIEIKCL